MASHAPVSTPATSSPRLVSRMVSRLRSKKRRDREQSPYLNDDSNFAAPLRPWPLPLVAVGHRGNLHLQGWTEITFPEMSDNYPWPHPLQEAYERLFQASRTFFELPEAEKVRWKSRLGSEEGWSSIPGEKEFVTLRSLEKTPDVLKEPAKKFWYQAGVYYDGVLERISQSLELDADEGERGLRRFMGPCRELQEKDENKTATMLRLFRYENDEYKVVAEPHSDLGMLSMVIGDTPGLEVWDTPSRGWFPIETNYIYPAATLLVGRQLERLTNRRYVAGGHRVMSYGPPRSKRKSNSPKGPNYRFSIVFVFRAHEPVTINTDDLTTNITGPFKEPIKDITAGQLYTSIQRKHYNINTNMKERNEQRQKLVKQKQEVPATG